jgi:hypothetical protein
VSRETPITLQALDTLLSSCAKFSSPVLCFMMGLLVWIMRVTFLCFDGFDTHIKTGNSHLFKLMCQIKSRLIQIIKIDARLLPGSFVLHPIMADSIRSQKESSPVVVNFFRTLK